MLATWVPDVLRAAGLTVITHPGWETRSHGELRTPLSVVWHHDASAVGDSPNMPTAMSKRWDTGDGIAAQSWVDRAGVWHIIASGVAWHAGRVLPGKCSNANSYGVETDHTTGEDWPPAQVDSLRRGTAAFLRHEGRAPDPALEFHKTICSPVGRKVDPDGLDLGTERAAVAALVGGVAPAPVAAAPVRHTAPGVTPPPFPLPRGWYFGPKSGPRESVSGYYSHRGDLRAWQARMAARGWRIGADGLYGPETADVARKFQAEKGLSVDGLIGPVTWRTAWTAPITN